MPLITFESGKLTDDMKAELIRRLTEVSAEITGIPAASFFISIRELPEENIAIGGKSVKDIKKGLGL
jgi:4-oxalocrotonate tautomerase